MWPLAQAEGDPAQLAPPEPDGAVEAGRRSHHPAFNPVQLTLRSRGFCIISDVLKYCAEGQFILITDSCGAS